MYPPPCMAKITQKIRSKKIHFKTANHLITGLHSTQSGTKCDRSGVDVAINSPGLAGLCSTNPERTCPHLNIKDTWASILAGEILQH